MPLNNWQPMDTAPHDGTPVLLWDGMCVVYAAFDGPMPEDEWEDLGPIEETYEEYCADCRNGWMSHEPITGDTEYILDPTHWMPIPDPPETGHA